MPTSPLPIVRTREDLRRAVAVWRADGCNVGLVPTMGALHDGHLSLIRLARQKADRVIASLFVNPAQFAPNEDFRAYPRDEAHDARLLAETGCDLLYAPSTEDIYPPGFASSVAVAGVSAPLEGASRPRHFAGVATVVAKLLIRAAPDVAVFGEKDYQQLLVVRRLVRDLDLAVEIIGAPTIRADDGLALSSRNAYLSQSERAVAGRLNVVLRSAAEALARGEPVDAVEARALACLGKAGVSSIDYLEARGADDLARQGPGPVDPPARLLAAVQVGKTRLIDNWPI
jgi:pantoate--beta-alanine ligase